MIIYYYILYNNININSFNLIKKFQFTYSKKQFFDINIFKHMIL